MQYDITVSRHERNSGTRDGLMHGRQVYHVNKKHSTTRGTLKSRGPGAQGQAQKSTNSPNRPSFALDHLRHPPFRKMPARRWRPPARYCSTPQPLPALSERRLRHEHRKRAVYMPPRREEGSSKSRANIEKERSARPNRTVVWGRVMSNGEWSQPSRALPCSRHGLHVTTTLVLQLHRCKRCLNHVQDLTPSRWQTSLFRCSLLCPRPP